MAVVTAGGSRALGFVPLGGSAIPQTTAEAIARGLVSPGGKLAPVLHAMEAGFRQAAPKTAEDALLVVARAASSIPGMAPGTVVAQEGGRIMIQHAGNVMTTLGSDGSILVTRGAQAIVRFVK